MRPKRPLEVGFLSVSSVAIGEAAFLEDLHLFQHNLLRNNGSRCSGPPQQTRVVKSVTSFTARIYLDAVKGVSESR